MEIRFTNHAKYRILERKIKISDIKLVIKNPDSYNYTFDDKIVVKKLINKKILEVVYKEIKNKALIITVYFYENTIR